MANRQGIFRVNLEAVLYCKLHCHCLFLNFPPYTGLKKTFLYRTVLYKLEKINLIHPLQMVNILCTMPKEDLFTSLEWWKRDLSSWALIWCSLSLSFVTIYDRIYTGQNTYGEMTQGYGFTSWWCSSCGSSLEGTRMGWGTWLSCACLCGRSSACVHGSCWLERKISNGIWYCLVKATVQCRK